jgi:hypothetical protein
VGVFWTTSGFENLAVHRCIFTGVNQQQEGAVGLIEVAAARAERATAGTAAAGLVAAAVGGGLLAQGGYYPRAQWFIGLLLCAAVLAVPGGLRGLRWRGALGAPAVAAAALAGWAVADGAEHGHVVAGLRYALLVTGMLVTLLVCSRLSRPAVESVVAALLTVGAVLAALGWLGVVLRVDRWAWQGDGVWRASSSLTYPNATAAVLAALALLCLALLTAQPRSMPLGLAATAMLAGLGATLSRAGVLGLLAGCAVLAVLAGPRALLRAGAAPVLGAAVALAGLLPSMPATAAAHPAVAAVALVAGLALGAGLPALVRSPRLAGTRPGWWLAAGAAPAGLLLLAPPVRHGLRVVAGVRLSLDSPDRQGALRAAWQAAVRHPVFGVGPGHPSLTWVRPGGGLSIYRYAHNEYLQVLLELGVLGLVLLAVLLLALVRVALRGAGGGPLRAAALAGSAALAVHAGLDFVWHLPAIPLLAAALTGLAVAEGPPRECVPQRRGAN